MATQKSLVYRVGTGKALGLVVGVMGFYLLPALVDEPSLLVRIGVLLWYPTLGAVVGVFGIFSNHPVLNLSLPWWFRGFIIGAWFNFVLTLFAYEQISTISIAMLGEYSAYISPFWMVLEGGIIGLIMDYLLTRWFGEGCADNAN
jgi:hypothetical protein